MFTLLANRRTIGIAKLTGESDVFDSDGFRTGDHTLAYSKPEKKKVVVSRRTGNAFIDPFGLDLDYAYTFVDDSPKQRYPEGSHLWIDVAPCEGNADYIIVAARKGLTHTLYAAKKI